MWGVYVQGVLNKRHTIQVEKKEKRVNYTSIVYGYPVLNRGGLQSSGKRKTKKKKTNETEEMKKREKKAGEKERNK